MGTLIIILTIVVAFFAGVIFQTHRMRLNAKTKGCPFKYACIAFDSVETRAAVKRVLTLLIENDVPKKEVETLVDNALK